VVAVIGRKGHQSVDQWREVWEHITEIVPRAAAELAVERAATEIQEVCYGHVPAIAWSGGKDSLALQVVVEAAGMGGMPGVCGVAADIEVPACLDYCLTHKPASVIVIDRADFTLAWLARNPQIPFQDNMVFTNHVTRWSQHEFQRRRPDVDYLLHGRRRIDRNYLNSKDPFGRHPSGPNRVTQYSPLRDWSHELTLAVIRYSGKPLSPTYDQPAGWLTGTGPWPGWAPHVLPGVTDPWAYAYIVDQTIVERAAVAGVAGAAQFLVNM
jgi:3'-phosphoadenosine 5'-phosphosulfate sulfotransferase (PAPS reductase)/FAD synthetase